MPRAGVQVRFLKTWSRSPKTSPRDLSHRRSRGRCEGSRSVVSSACSREFDVVLPTLSICASLCHMDGPYLERLRFVTRAAASLHVGRRYDIPCWVSCSAIAGRRKWKWRNANSESMKMQCSQTRTLDLRERCDDSTCSEAPIWIKVHC